MGEIPRKIEKIKIKGFVYCQGIGLLCCENNEDRKKLLALSQIYRQAVKNGEIIESKYSLPQYRGQGGKDFQTLNVLGEHLMKNIKTFSSKEHDSHELLCKQLSSQNIEIIALKAQNGYPTLKKWRGFFIF